jgi:hypothetical protein
MTGNTIAISQFDGTVKLMKIELSTGAREIVPAKDIGEEKITFGMFEVEESNHRSESIALVATPQGPLLIFNDTLYRPNAAQTKVDIADDKEISHFRILHQGTPIFGLFYKEKFGIGLHPYNRDREDIDFYFWLKNKINEPKFYKAYTREIVFLD